MTSAHRHERTYVAFSRELALCILHANPRFSFRVVDVSSFPHDVSCFASFIADVSLDDCDVTFYIRMIVKLHRVHFFILLKLLRFLLLRATSSVTTR